jgi:ParB-like chromosome segregation protein Spo0J
MKNKTLISRQELIYKSVEELIPYAKNSRIHDENQVAQISASIREFGFTNPVLIDGDNGIIAGHGRVLAARNLKLDTVPCIQLSHLTDAQKKAYIIADNKLGLNSKFDDEILALEIQELTNIKFDIDVIGFDEDEIKKILYLPEELAEKKLEIKPIKKTRILISIDTNSIPDIAEVIEMLKQSGAEIDFSGN